MTPRYILLFWAFVTLCCHFAQSSRSCSSGTVRCETSNQCINLRDVCRNGMQCTDGSDEDLSICSFWTYSDDSCGREGNFLCTGSYYGCRTIYDFCMTYSCTGKDSRICEMVKDGILKTDPGDPGMTLTDELLNLLKKAVNTTSLQSASTPCPMFYTRVGTRCLAFFSPAKVPWAEARQFCLSIMGELLKVDDLPSYGELLDYMRLSHLTTDYWIGGRFDMDTNAWAWVADDSAMPLGSPYWATRYSSSCVPRSPPHTDPFSSPAEALPGAPCYNYLQAPAQRKQGWCAAMTYEHYYTFSDEKCQDNRSPICVFNEKLRITIQ